MSQDIWVDMYIPPFRYEFTAGNWETQMPRTVETLVATAVDLGLGALSMGTIWVLFCGRQVVVST